ncbi:MAG: glycosyltransferase [Cyanobacteria bacterium P01_E01_bin.34]
MKLMVYSHDTYGLGNIRRMLAICEHLLATIPNLSILLVSGAPMSHSFRMPAGLDYIKLPCLRRNESGELAAKYLGTSTEDTVRWRAESIRSAAMNFKPDLLLVDKKPHGLMGELHPTLDWLTTHSPATKLVLLLRDILYSPEKTVRDWQQYGYLDTLRDRFHRIWVVGDPTVFDLRREYCFPPAVATKVDFCGYLRKPPSITPPELIRSRLGVESHQQLVLVTPGGGEDGFHLVSNYLESIEHISSARNIKNRAIKSLIVCGPDMPEHQRKSLQLRVQFFPDVMFQEFTNDLMGYMAAADAVLSMAGYNTTCEILSLQQRAVVVPRTKPVLEQAIRADCLAQLGLIDTIHPERLTPKRLAHKLLSQLDKHQPPEVEATLNMNGLQNLSRHLMVVLPLIESKSDPPALCSSPPYITFRTA